VKLDKGIADKICEEALDVRNVTQRLRKAVKSSLNELDTDPLIRSAFVRDKFMMASQHDSQRRINEKHFQVFLHSLKLFFTDLSVNKIFTIIDFDQDGWVTWTDLRPILFPELQKKNVNLTIRQSIIDKRRMSFDYSRQKNVDDDSHFWNNSASNSTRTEPKFYLNKIFGALQLSGRSKDSSVGEFHNAPDEGVSDQEAVMEDKQGDDDSDDWSEEDESMVADRSQPVFAEALQPPVRRKSLRTSANVSYVQAVLDEVLEAHHSHIQQPPLDELPPRIAWTEMDAHTENTDNHPVSPKPNRRVSFNFVEDPLHIPHIPPSATVPHPHTVSILTSQLEGDEDEEVQETTQQNFYDI